MKNGMRPIFGRNAPKGVRRRGEVKYKKLPAVLSSPTPHSLHLQVTMPQPGVYFIKNTVNTTLAVNYNGPNNQLTVELFNGELAQQVSITFV